MIENLEPRIATVETRMSATEKRLGRHDQLIDVNETRIQTVELKASVCQQQVDKIDHSLFGNGQPGALAKLEKKIDDLSDKLTKVIVAVGVMAGASGYGLHEIISIIFGG